MTYPIAYRLIFITSILIIASVVLSGCAAEKMAAGQLLYGATSGSGGIPNQSCKQDCGEIYVFTSQGRKRITE